MFPPCKPCRWAQCGLSIVAKSEEFGWVAGGRDQIDTLVIVFGHKVGPRAGFLEPLSYYSPGLDMVMGSAAGSSFVMNKWHFLSWPWWWTLRVPCGWPEKSSLAEVSVPWVMLTKFTYESYCVDNLKSVLHNQHSCVSSVSPQWPLCVRPYYLEFNRMKADKVPNLVISSVRLSRAISMEESQP